MFIIKWTFKLTGWFLMALGAYYLFMTNFQPTDFFDDTKKVFQDNVDLDLKELKEQASLKISEIMEEGAKDGEPGRESRIKEVVHDVIDEVGEKTGRTKSAGPLLKKESIAGCREGYFWDGSRPIPCVQSDCEELVFAEIDNNGRCVCREKEKIECFKSSQDSECPGCLYACVDNDELCP